MPAKKSALLVVDVQNDFCPGGALAVPEGDRVVPVLNEYMARFAEAGLPIYASRDWHPTETKHFQAFGGAWPPHCIQDMPGAAFHPELRLPAQTTIVTKGANPEEDAYSAFQGQTDEGLSLTDALARAGVTHLYVGGLATDYCVRASALDARKHGLQVTLLVDAARGVDMQPGDSERAIEEMAEAKIAMGTLDSVHPETS